MVLMMGGPTVDDPNSRPFDSFDFTCGIPVASGSAYVMHYSRANSGADGLWRFIYPGRYNGINFQRRQQGTQMPSPVEVWNPLDPTQFDPFDPAAGGTEPTPGMTLGYTAGVAAPNDNPQASYPNTFPTQLMNVDPAVNPLGAGPAKFPFGAFARNGDILQVPFIGTYRVTYAGGANAGKLIEINPIAMDAAFAEDGTDVDDAPVGGADDGSLPREQLGRFCPIGRRTGTSASGAAVTIDDFSTDPGAYRYAWAKKLFDYLAVDGPSNDFLPNVKPSQYTLSGGSRLPQPVDNDGDGVAASDETGSTTAGKEDTVPVHGLINISTAPWRVLAMLPFFPTGQDKYSWSPGGQLTLAADKIDDNIDLAKAIAYWRDVDDTSTKPGGPFTSIFDLYRVPAFAEAQRLAYLDTAAPEPDFKEGDFAPVSGAADGVRRDFEECYLLLNKVSNLITTRSDSFTVYILVQGWRGANGANPQLVVQRRAAFIQDRSSVTAGARLPAAVNVPND